MLFLEKSVYLKLKNVCNDSNNLLCFYSKPRRKRGAKLLFAKMVVFKFIYETEVLRKIFFNKTFKMKK